MVCNEILQLLWKLEYWAKFQLAWPKFGSGNCVRQIDLRLHVFRAKRDVPGCEYDVCPSYGGVHLDILTPTFLEGSDDSFVVAPN